MEHNWYLYLLRCADGTLYCGITTDVDKRLQQHRSGKGAKYTRGRAPLELVYTEECGNHSAALKREYLVKQLSREEKQKLIKANTPGGLTLRGEAMLCIKIDTPKKEKPRTKGAKDPSSTEQFRIHSHYNR